MTVMGTPNARLSFFSRGMGSAPASLIIRRCLCLPARAGIMRQEMLRASEPTTTSGDSERCRKARIIVRGDRDANEAEDNAQIRLLKNSFQCLA